MVASHCKQAFLIGLVSVLLLCDDVHVSALDHDSKPRTPKFGASIEPIIRNRHANVFPFHTALFPQLNIRQAIFGETTTTTTTTTLNKHFEITKTPQINQKPTTHYNTAITPTKTTENPITTDSNIKNPYKPFITLLEPSITPSTSFETAKPLSKTPETVISSLITPENLLISDPNSKNPSMINDKPFITPENIKTSSISPENLTKTFTATTTIILPGQTVTSFTTQTATTTLYSTKTVVFDFSHYAKVIPFDRAATANPECKLEVSTKTLTTDSQEPCTQKTITITKNALLKATRTVTGVPVTEIHKTTVLKTKSTTAMAVPQRTVTNLVTVLPSFTAQRSCELFTVFETVSKLQSRVFTGDCPLLQTTVTVGTVFDRKTVTKYDKQTMTETLTVDRVTACQGAVTKTASATELTILNYDYFTETITDRASYPIKCLDSMVTVTETVNPTSTVKLLQVSFIKEFKTGSKVGLCQSTVFLTPSVVSAELVNEFVRLTRTVVTSSYDFGDSVTGVFVLTPTVKVTETRMVDVTVTEIMADHNCALK